MKIAISGATGLIGSTFKEFFLRNGHQVSVISRHRGFLKKTSDIFWDLNKNYIDTKALEGHDVIIHLAGANISAQNWSAAYKKEIRDSRIKSTRLLVQTIQCMSNRPKVFLCASAFGYYGHQEPEAVVDEKSPAGSGFLADVCREWENASADLVLYGVRLVHMRFGIVLSKKGGALAKMLPFFYWGLGGRLASGRQKMSWIAIDEIPRMVDFIIGHEEICGPVNMVSPKPVTNAEFTKTLGRVIDRPTIFPVPAAMIKLFFGQMGQELLLEGAHVKPSVFLNTGYNFQYPDLTTALKHIL
ncbi:MAG: TIGR01777 family protein [Candidatus Omnitrophica bacterium]|nr:TIGR01777 family protein [Candidatus Omnitrophota bacterium]